MPKTIVEKLAQFTTASLYEQLPHAVVHEAKRILLDSIGCALAGLEMPKGRAGVDFGRLMGGLDGNASILGGRVKTSVVGAAFANAELINTLDMDCVLPPGHVAPAVVASVLAVGETEQSGGKAIIEAIAIAHEMSYRFGKAMVNLRDTKNGESHPPSIFGYTSPIFGATAAIGRLKGYSTEVVANSIGIAACISPVNSMMTWIHNAPATTIKYTVMGVLAQQAFTAACMGEFGHRGDLKVLDDSEYGYARFIGTEKWETQHFTDALGSEWRFPAETSYKPYPHCRVFNALQDCVIKIVEENDLKPDEIDGIKVYVEGFAQKPVWVNRDILDVHDAQFSMYHGIAVAAHRVTPGKDWLAPELIHSRSVMTLMGKVTSEVHPDYVKLLTGNNASRPARVEVLARGRTFVEERRYPKGSRSPEHDSYMTDDELVGKFRHNAKGVLAQGNINSMVDAVMNLECVDNFASVLSLGSGQ